MSQHVEDRLLIADFQWMKVEDNWKNQGCIAHQVPYQLEARWVDTETEIAAKERDTQAFVEEAVASVRDLEEPEFSARERDAKTFVEEAIAAVRDLEETEFAAEPRDAEVTMDLATT